MTATKVDRYLVICPHCLAKIEFVSTDIKQVLGADSFEYIRCPVCKSRIWISNKDGMYKGIVTPIYE